MQLPVHIRTHIIHLMILKCILNMEEMEAKEIRTTYVTMHSRSVAPWHVQLLHIQDRWVRSRGLTGQAQKSDLQYSSHKTLAN